MILYKTSIYKQQYQFLDKNQPTKQYNLSNSIPNSQYQQQQSKKIILLQNNFYSNKQHKKNLITIKKMYRTHHSNLQITTQQQDPRIKSKHTTPKRNTKQKNKTNYNQDDQQQYLNDKTQYKKPEYVQFFNEYRNKNENRQRKDRSRQLEVMMEDKLRNYQIVAGTLKEYIKQQELDNKNKNNTKYINTVIDIIKAYTKSQITQISPSVSKLIRNILSTLQLPYKKQKKSTQNSPIKKPNPKSQQSPSIPIHSRQYSFGRQIHKISPTLQKQIDTLQNQLLDLQKQGKILQQLQQQFQQMNEMDKNSYIKQLQNIIHKQNSILEQYGNN